MFSKRGLSQVVSTILLILLGVVVVGVVWVFVADIVNDNVDGSNAGKFKVTLEVTKVEINQDSVLLTLKRGIGDGDLSGVRFLVFNGSEENITEVSGTIKELESKTFAIPYSGFLKSFSVIPLITSESGKTLTGSLVKKEYTNAEMLEHLGAVSWWKFEENADAEIGSYDCYVEDKNGGNTDGDNPPSLGNGKFGQSYQFDGTDDVVNCGDILEEVFVANNYTIAFWVNGEETDAILLEKWSSSPGGSNDNSFLLWNRRFHSDTQTTFNSYLDFVDGDWHFLVFAVEEGTLNSYQDGIPVIFGASNHASDLNDMPFVIGGHRVFNTDPNYFFKGSIDEVMVFNRALSQGRIQSLYELDLDD